MNLLSGVTDSSQDIPLDGTAVPVRRAECHGALLLTAAGCTFALDHVVGGEYRYAGRSARPLVDTACLR